MKIWDPDLRIKEWPVYMSFPQGEYSANIRKGAKMFEIPFYCELPSGVQNPGLENKVRVEVVKEETTAVEEVHYALLIMQDSNAKAYRNLFLQQSIITNWKVQAAFRVYSENVDKEVILTLAMKAGAVEPPTGVVVTQIDRPLYDTIRIKILPELK